MSSREQAINILNQLPEYKMNYIVAFLKGFQMDDEIERKGNNGMLDEKDLQAISALLDAKLEPINTRLDKLEFGIKNIKQTQEKVTNKSLLNIAKQYANVSQCVREVKYISDDIRYAQKLREIRLNSLESMVKQIKEGK